MPKKRILNELQITAIAAVDRPAQEGALSTILKRADDQIEKLVIPEADLGLLTKSYLDPMDGAQPFEAFLDERARNKTYWERLEENGICEKIGALADSLRSIAGDGSLDMTLKTSSMQEAMFNFLQTVNSDWPDAPKDIVEAISLFRDNYGKRSDLMPKSLEEQVADLTKSLGEVTEKLEKAETDRDEAVAKAEAADAISKLSDDEKSFMDGMDDKAKKEFMSLSAEDRAKRMKKAADNDETLEYDGNIVKRSDVGDAQFAIFKSLIAKNEALEKSANEKDADLAKSRNEAEAERDFPNVPGDKTLKGKMLSVMDGADEDVRKAFREILTSHNEMLGKGMVTVGSDGKTVKTASSPEAIKKFEERISEIKKRDSVSDAEAWKKAPVEFPEDFEAYQAAQN